MVHFPQPLIPATIRRRENRFRVTVTVNGHEVGAHLANSGRLEELLTPGAVCFLAAATNPARLTPFDLLLVERNGCLVSADARQPNALFLDLLERGHAGQAEARGLLGDLAEFEAVVTETRVGRSRLDFKLSGQGRPPCWVECKSVTLVDDGCARFPDAPSARACKHLAELEERVEAGEDAAIVFVVQRSDARLLDPNRVTDPAFAAALAHAHGQGIRVLAYGCSLSTFGIEIATALPVVL